MSMVLRLAAWLLAIALIASPVVAVVEGWIGVERWPLRTLRLQGELQRVDRGDLQKVVRPYAARGFFAVDLDAIRHDVSQLPWVAKVEVRKQWPDILEVAIHEHRPYARWGQERLLSEDGQLFPAGSLQIPEGLPELDGPESRVQDVVALHDVANRHLAGVGGVKGVVMDARGSWSIHLHDGMTLVLGRNDPELRLERFAPLLPKLLEQHSEGLQRADLRYTNGFALVWSKAPRKNNDAGTAAHVQQQIAASRQTKVGTDT
jgi:cell division protein FtsQ